MNNYVTGSAIRLLREKKGYTQKQLAERLMVSDKAVSKWESGRGLPDISLIEPLAKTLGISVAELLSGECIQNTNRHGNMYKSRFYVCPVCGNVIFAAIKTIIARSLAKEETQPKVLNPWIHGLFNKLDNLKFISYVDSDGFPVVLPLIQTQALDANRVVFALGAFSKELRTPAWTRPRRCARSSCA